MEQCGSIFNIPKSGEAMIDGKGKHIFANFIEPSSEIKVLSIFDSSCNGNIMKMIRPTTRIGQKN